MENEIKQSHEYAFLSEDDVVQYFSDINFKLLSGVHIDNRHYAIFSVLEKYENQWRSFYASLYNLNLVQDIFDREVYYYLEFFTSGKGKLSDNSLHIALTEMQTITGLMLMDMYYQRYFEAQKIISWADIRQQIEESDHRANYQRILFNVTRLSYSENEWQSVEKKFRDAIHSFDKLGWVSKESSLGEELIFEIRPAIHRLAKLYSSELENFENFSIMLKQNEEA